MRWHLSRSAALRCGAARISSGALQRASTGRIRSPCMEGQQRLEGFKVVALDQEISGGGIAHLFDGIEKPVRHFARRAFGFLIAEPGQLGREVTAVRD